jgi:hypothetical protein
MIARENAIIARTPAADYTGKEGYFVKVSGSTVTLCTGTTDAPLGVITEGSDTSNKCSVALHGGGLAGTVKVKVTGTTPGTIVFGSPLELAAEDGTVKLGTGGGATVVGTALESGAANELIEAILTPAPGGTLTLDKTFLTTCVSTADGAVMTTTGQVTDGSGNALAGYFVVGVCYSEAANTGIPYDFGNPAATSGTVIIKEHTADALLEVLTKSDGTWGLENTFTADDTGHVAAWVIGKTAASTVAVDVP